MPFFDEPEELISAEKQNSGDQQESLETEYSRLTQMSQEFYSKAVALGARPVWQDRDWIGLQSPVFVGNGELHFIVNPAGRVCASQCDEDSYFSPIEPSSTRGLKPTSELVGKVESCEVYTLQQLAKRTL